MNCEKQYRITVNDAGYDGLYLPLDEPSGDRIDSSQGVIFTPIGPGGWQDGPGHVNNCWQSDFTNEFQSIGLDMNAAIETLAYVGNSVSMWGWMRMTDQGSVTMQFRQNNSAVFGDTADYWLLRMRTFTNDAIMFTSVGPNVTMAVADVTAWNLIVGLWDAATNKAGISVNGSAISWSAAGAAFAAKPYGSAGFDITPDGSLPIPNGGLDEAGIIRALLTDAQIAYLYNGGVGRSWPIVFP